MKITLFRASFWRAKAGKVKCKNCIRNLEKALDKTGKVGYTNQAVSGKRKQISGCSAVLVARLNAKTQHSNRELPLPKPLLRTLRKLHGKYSDNIWFLSGNEERPVEPRCYRKSIQCYLKQARIRKIYPHVLRHTFATTCLQAGCDIKTLSELLGHSNATITLQRYVHSDLNRMRQELERITRRLYKGSDRSYRLK